MVLMADWSDLPQEILYLISLLLTASSSIDILRFRSVCTTWRRAAFQPPVLFPSTFRRCVPLPVPISLVLGEFFHLTKRTIYHLQNTDDNNPSSWIIKFNSEHLCFPLTSHLPQNYDNPSSIIRYDFEHLLNPLTSFLLEPVSQNLPKPFSFLNLRVRELGVDYRAYFTGRGCKCDHKFIRKVAVLKQLDNTFVMLLAEAHMFVISKSGDEEWRFLTTNEVHYDDVIVMGGEFYVVGNPGRQLARLNSVDWSEEIIVASPPTKNWARKFLVECQGNLMLVEYDFDFYEQFSSDWFPDEIGYRFETIQVFKLDENSRKWMEVNDLGEMILFIGETCSFAASAKDVFGDTSTTAGWGNCIICWSEELDCSRVLDLENRSIKGLDSLPHYSKMFWPPPEWAYSASDN